jgi:hypothetical protein
VYVRGLRLRSVFTLVKITVLLGAVAVTVDFFAPTHEQALE